MIINNINDDDDDNDIDNNNNKLHYTADPLAAIRFDPTPILVRTNARKVEPLQYRHRRDGAKCLYCRGVRHIKEVYMLSVIEVSVLQRCRYYRGVYIIEVFIL